MLMMIIGIVLGILWFVVTNLVIRQKSEKQLTAWKKNSMTVIILLSIISKRIGGGILIGLGVFVAGMLVYALITGGMGTFKECLHAAVEAGKKVLLDEKSESDTTAKTEGAA